MQASTHLNMDHRIHSNMPGLVPFSLVSRDRVRLSPFFFSFNSLSGGWSPTGSTRHGGHWLAYCSLPGWLWWWRIWWYENWQEKPNHSEKVCPSATSSTTSPTWPDLGSNSGRRGGKPATNCLNYGTAKTPAQLRIVWQASTVRWWNICSLSTGAAYTRVFRCPHRWIFRGFKSGERGGHAVGLPQPIRRSW
jgi:hypothetical protein